MIDTGEKEHYTNFIGTAKTILRNESIQKRKWSRNFKIESLTSRRQKR